MLYASFVYGFNTAIERCPLWRDIQQLSIGIASTPWILMGDFNVVRHPAERLGGDLTWHPYLDDFNTCCYQSSLDDLRYSGHYLTWSNKSPEDKLISSKLDRALINVHWDSIFNGSTATFLPPGVSDHCPVLVSMGVAIRLRKPSFKFFNFWTEHPDFEDLISSTWNTSINGFPLYQISQKLKLIKEKLKSFNRSNFGHIQDRVSSAKRRLVEIQNLLQLQPQDACLRQ